MSYFIKDTTAHLKLHLQLFIRGLGSIEMKYGQMLAQLVANISDLFLALLWRVEANSTPFYDFYNNVLGSVNFEYRILSFNALGVYLFFFLILGWASIGEGR